MYFEKFPQSFYTLDNRTTVQLVTNITVRNIVKDAIKENYSIYDEYDIKDGETPEILADKFYNNPNYHWIILHMNDIIDPRFDWPLTQPRLIEFVIDKYGNTSAIHHYENVDGDPAVGNIFVSTSTTPTIIISQNDVIVNVTDDGVGVVEYAVSQNNYNVKVGRGGFRTGCKVALYSNTLSNVSVISTTINNSVVPVTVLDYEEQQNESKRRIKILKPQFVESFVNEFYSKLETLNG